MLATQLNELAENGSLSVGSIVQLAEFITQTLNGQQILVLLNLNIVGHDDSVANDGERSGTEQTPPVCACDVM